MSVFYLWASIVLLGMVSRIPLFYFFGTVLFATPVIAWIPGLMFGYSAGLWVASGAGVILVLYFLGGIKDLTLHSLSQRPVFEWIPIGVFFVIFGICYFLALQWTVFFPMGERLRDYALLWATIDNPGAPREPWMAGYPLYYYVFWYRFASAGSAVLGLKVWELYHVLVSFPLAFYCAGIVALLGTLQTWTVWGRLSAALIIALGSNVQGIMFSIFNQQDGGWWGPSRVIKGAINEYPSWSFILGDAHPHYLSISLFPFLLGLCMLCRRTLQNNAVRVVSLFFLLIIGLLLYLNANPWETPMYGIFLALLLCCWSLKAWRWDEGKISWTGLLHECKSLQMAAVVVLGSIFAVSLFLSKPEVLAGDSPIAMVRDPIELSKTLELLRHFGLPLVVSALSLSFCIAGVPFGIASLCFFVAALLFEDGFAIVLFLLFLSFYRLLGVFREAPYRHLFFEITGFASFGLILLPELWFLNDPYGGEAERMNTIFKVYTFVWMPVHLASFYYASSLYSQVKKRFKNPIPVYCAQGITVFLFCFCFFYMSLSKSVRRREATFSDRYDSEGLGRVERTYQGARETIRFLRDSMPGVVLEAQFHPYNWTAHVSTLSHQYSYLGWANHVELLIRDYEEANRRKEITRRVYEGTACDETRKLLFQEHIRYVVFGPLEQQVYNENPQSLSCLKPIHTSGAYTVYEP